MCWAPVPVASVMPSPSAPPLPLNDSPTGRLAPAPKSIVRASGPDPPVTAGTDPPVPVPALGHRVVDALRNRLRAPLDQLAALELRAEQRMELHALQEAVHRIYAAYNTPDFRQYLSERFYDPERLVEAIAEKVPREAVLRLISIASIPLRATAITCSSGCRSSSSEAD